MPDAPDPRTADIYPVALVGAGPGDPDLITLGAVARLALADTVVFDRLVNPALLRHARDGAVLVDAGKATGDHTLSQDEINALLVERARAGQRVVRLKGGDPFVFGRGGEEAAALAAAGLPFEVVPGVTSAVAAPSYAGIPLTHRGISASFSVVAATAFVTEGPGRAPTFPTGETLVILMGAARLAALTARLLEEGRDPETPAAVIEWGTLPRQRTVTGTLTTIASLAADARIEPPAVIVLGDVVRLREDLAWFDTRPLAGLRVLVTRTRDQAGELSRRLADLGADAIELPTIEVVETWGGAAVGEALQALRSSAYQWCIFTSPNAIAIITRLLHERGLDARAFGRAQIAVAGPGTADVLARAGLVADLVPAQYAAEGLLDAFASRPLRGAGILVPRAEDARDTLLDGLRGRGAIVDELLLYRAAVPRDLDAEGMRALRDGVDVVTFASSSAVRNLIQMLGGDLTPLRRARIAVIGPVTAAAVRAAGLEVAIEPPAYTIPALVQEIVHTSART